MSAETELNAALSGYAPLTAVVAARIYPDFLAQEIVLPAVVFQREETEYVTTIHDGVVHGAKVHLDVYCLAATRIAAESLADLVEDALETSFLPVNRTPLFDPETLTYTTIVTCSVWPA